MRKHLLLIVLITISGINAISQSISERKDSLKIESIKKQLPKLKGIDRIDKMILLVEHYTDKTKYRVINALDSIRYYGDKILNESKPIGYKKGIAMGLLATAPDSLKEKRAWEGTIYLPPLLLQPFCENAIWHGLMHKEGQGVLDIAMSMQDNILNCIIIDNGIGRGKAAELNSKSAEKEKSLGLKITTSRLELFNRSNLAQTSYTIEDLYDEKGEASGTKVTVQIKYKNSIEEYVSE